MNKLQKLKELNLKLREDNEKIKFAIMKLQNDIDTFLASSTRSRIVQGDIGPEYPGEV